MSPEDMLVYLDRVCKGIAESKRIKRPRLQDWDRRKRPLRYRYSKSPVQVTPP